MMEPDVYFDALYSKLQENRNNHERGYYNCIPFRTMPRLEKFIPGVEQATYYGVTASSGVGKSKLSRYLFTHLPMMYVNSPLNTNNVEVDILYFSLEESKEKIILSEISRYLRDKEGIELGVKQLKSVGKYNALSQEELLAVGRAKNYVENYLKKVQIFDTVRNPTGIFKKVRDFAYKVGRYYDSDGTLFTEEEMENIRTGLGGDLYQKIAGYSLINPNHYVIVLIDHISLLETEKDMLGLKQAIDKLSNDYCLKMRDRFNFIPVVVQQQAADKEKVQFTAQGKNIFEKLEPSLDGLGDSKTTQRDVNVFIGLFAPNRYGMDDHNGYDISFFKDNYRALTILKDRDGTPNIKVPLFFDGQTDFFAELPRLDDIASMQRAKSKIAELQNKRKERQ